MTTFKYIALMLIVLSLCNCIGTDLEESFPEDFRIIVPENDLRVNGRVTLEATFTDASGIAQSVPVSWFSSDVSVVEIIQGQVATGRSAGTALITATTSSLQDPDKMLYAEITLTVLPSREALTITTFVDMLETGESFQFDVNYLDIDGKNSTTAIEWRSTDPDIASISSSGVVTGISEGQTIITASTPNVSDQVTVTVSNNPVMREPEVRITTFVNSLIVGENFLFQAIYLDETAMPDNTVNILWQSSDEEVMTIDPAGNATAVAEGITTLVAMGNGISTSITVSVEAADQVTRTGTLNGTGYDITGSFSLSEDDKGDLILSFEDASIDNNAPGPYFYLTNQETNVSGGINLGKSRDGTFSINISESFPDVRINTYQHVMVWCEPFNVRLGIGSFDN